MKTIFEPYNPGKLYDLILLLAGENTAIDKESGMIKSNPNYYPRSKKAVQILQTGNIKRGILVTGGYGGLDPAPLGISGGKRSYDFLAETEPTEFLYLDERSRETLGNFALPATTSVATEKATELITNPDFNSLENFLLITEEGHMKRALACAAKVIPYEKMDFLAVEGPYKPGFATKTYHSSLMRATRHITSSNPEDVLELLTHEHPFYRYGDEQWFKKSLDTRRFLLMLTCLEWIACNP